MTKTLEMMTTQQLKAHLDDLETKKFLLAMADHWDASDYDYDSNLALQIRLTKKELEARATA